MPNHSICAQFSVNAKPSEKSIMKTETNDNEKSGHASVPLKIHYQVGQQFERIDTFFEF